MNFYRLRQVVFAAALALLLAAASFAAPLCACLNVSANSRDCCEKMQDHCPMKNLRVDSLDKTSQPGCECSVEKRENAPTKISDNSSSPQKIAAATFNLPLAVFAGTAKLIQEFFLSPLVTKDPLLNRTSARAPPGL